MWNACYFVLQLAAIISTSSVAVVVASAAYTTSDTLAVAPQTVSASIAPPSPSPSVAIPTSNNNEAFNINSTSTTTTTIKVTPTKLTDSSIATATTTTTTKTITTTFMGNKINNNNNNDNHKNNDNNTNETNNVRRHDIINHTRNDAYGIFSTLDKEVVDHLIRQWAPVVWLAPEEKFMPLGVEEFLNHVHPMDKDKTFIPGMPIGDDSKKAFLVTNNEIEELLENENSFIYGRNPNEAPVPIYAVAKLCDENCRNGNSVEQTGPSDDGVGMYPPASEFAQLHQLAAAQAQMETQPQMQSQPAATASSIINTRGPYIPVSINPLEERNNTVRRSSRLYPVFKRVRRQLMSATGGAPPSPLPGVGVYMANQLPLNTFAANVNYNRMPMSGVGSNEFEDKTTEPTETVNNFIANLADNVKFSPVSVTNDIDDNDINLESSFNEPSPILTPERRRLPSFHVTYWMFYPYSQGKTMCTLSLGPLGSIPFPAVYGFCLGRRKDIGSHIGDWEHMSLFFDGGTEPTAMYVSAHDAGAYYTYNHLTGAFEYKKQETRKGILQRPNFPKTVTTFNNHPVLFAAKGSHGLWTAPGKHRFVKVARLYDINGFGTPWNTWKAIDITYENIKSHGRSLIHSWLSFKGKWGNPKSKCHPFRRIGLNFCEYTDGPTGIPLKEPHFECGATYR